jgi:hypothetical protein
MKKINAKLTSLLIDQEQWNKSIFLWFLILLGIALPFLLVTFIDSYFQADVHIFHTWGECWIQRSYIDCQPKQPPNYPVAGLALSAGVIHTINSTFGITERTTVDLIFRYYLAFFDSLNFLLFIWLAKLMRFPFPIFIGMILLIIPSTWVGSAVWGQIDGISLFFCLLSVICFLKSWQFNDLDTGDKKAWKSGIYLFLGTGSFAIYILTKQLAIFSLPFFLLLGLSCCAFKMHNSKSKVKSQKSKVKSEESFRVLFLNIAIYNLAAQQLNNYMEIVENISIIRLNFLNVQLYFVSLQP